MSSFLCSPATRIARSVALTAARNTTPSGLFFTSAAASFAVARALTFSIWASRSWMICSGVRRVSELHCPAGRHAVGMAAVTVWLHTGCADKDQGTQQQRSL